MHKAALHPLLVFFTFLNRKFATHLVIPTAKKLFGLNFLPMVTLHQTASFHHGHVIITMEMVAMDT